MPSVQQRIAQGARYFEIYPCGDPYSRAWDCTESDGPDAPTGIYRGDLGHLFGKVALANYLRRSYPGCIVALRYK